MRITQTPPSLVSLILVLLSNTPSVFAGPYPKNELHDFGFGYLMDRGCDSYCGLEDQYCCSAGSTCFTNSLTIAECITSAPAGGWQYYTTLTTETDLIVKTITISSFTGAAATTTPANPETTVACQYALGQIACGAICCKSSQYCAEAGQCLDSSTTTGTTTYSAPVLGTSGASTVTQTATTTRPFETPVGTGSGSSIGVTSASTSSSHLSGGAIAGIVIGVLAAIVLLILICFCCIVRSGWDALLSLLGLRNRNRRREEVVTTEERYSRRNAGAGGSRAQTHRGWFGGASRPQRTTTVSEKRRDGGLGNLGFIGAGLLGLAAILGLKRRNDRVVKEERVTSRVNRERSDISSDYYSDYYTDPSSVSSDDRRTRTTHHTTRR